VESCGGFTPLLDLFPQGTTDRPDLRKLKAISNIKRLSPNSLKNSKNDNIFSFNSTFKGGDRPFTLNQSVDTPILANIQSLTCNFWENFLRPKIKAAPK
jgi:hypothetical protein